jgi:hypothetical protein
MQNAPRRVLADQTADGSDRFAFVGRLEHEGSERPDWQDLQAELEALRFVPVEPAHCGLEIDGRRYRVVPPR